MTTFEVLRMLDTGSGSTLEDYKFLYGFVSLIRPKRIIEIGTNYGGSAVAMAMALRDEKLEESKIVSIDINLGCLKIAENQLGQLDLLKYVELHHGTSKLVRNYSHFDMAFIDGDHSYEGCLTDFNNIKNNATYILIHDSAQFEEITKAIQIIKNMKIYQVLNLDIGNQGIQWSLNKPKYHSYPGFVIIKTRR